jgi:hypothetical protein
MSSNNALKNTVLRILRTPGMEKIGFQLGALTVTGQKIALVAQAIDVGRIECRTVGEIKVDGPISPGKGNVIEARYKEELDAMLFRDESYGTGPGENRTIVHEAVHAAFDLLAPRSKFKTLAIEDESAAVLTEAIYIKVCNKPVGGFRMEVEGPQWQAWNLAGLMSTATDEFTKGGIYALDPSETADLREAVAKSWGFTKVKDSTGYTDNRGALYMYNGVVKCSKTGVCR